jgi:hypothetical protein
VVFTLTEHNADVLLPIMDRWADIQRQLEG